MTNAVYAVVITPAAPTVQVSPMAQLGKVIAVVSQLITQVMTVMIVRKHLTAAPYSIIVTLVTPTAQTTVRKIVPVSGVVRPTRTTVAPVIQTRTTTVRKTAPALGVAQLSKMIVVFVMVATRMT